MTTLRQLIDNGYFDVESNDVTDTTDYYVKDNYEIHFGKHEYAFFEVLADDSVIGYPLESDKEYELDSVDADISFKVKVFEITKTEIVL